MSATVTPLQQTSFSKDLPQHQGSKETSLANDYLNKVWKKGTDFLGCEYAILGGAMTWVSESNLVAAISNAGGFGILASGSMSADLLDTEIQKTKEKTSKPFGVNLITLHPELDALIDVCIKQACSHVILAGGIPPKYAIQSLKDHNIKVICFAPALALAKRMIKYGADALVIEGNEAGGHIGPVSTSVLAQEILPHITDVPVFIAGGIGRGETMLSYLEMGASGCQLGTRFVCATECTAHPNFKKAFVKAAARNAGISSQLDPRLPVIPVRALTNKGTENFMAYQREMIEKVNNQEIEITEAQLMIEHYWAGALRKAVVDGDVEQGSLMAGQSVGLVTKEEPVASIIADLREQALPRIEQRAL